MEINQLLKGRSDEIVTSAVQALERAHVKHYEADGLGQARARLEALYNVVAQCLENTDAGPILKHAEKVAEERFIAGFDLQEVQTTFNVLEETIWHHAFISMKPEELFHAIGSVSTILGMGKDALARTYVSLASGKKVPALNLEELFRCAEGS